MTVKLLRAFELQGNRAYTTEKDTPVYDEFTQVIELYLDKNEIIVQFQYKLELYHFPKSAFGYVIEPNATVVE